MKYFILPLILINACITMRATTTAADAFKQTQAAFELANQYTVRHEYETAINMYDALLRISPENTPIIYNKAYALKSWGHMHAAIALYEDVLRRTPENDHARYGLGQAYLATGNFTDGWFMLQWRSANIEKWHPAMTNLKNEFAHNKQLFKNKTVFIYSEFGFGDTFQMIRYAQLLKHHGAIVIVQTFPELIPLFSLCSYIDKVVPVGGQLYKTDFSIPLMSLPLVFDTQLNTIPAPIPYLKAPQHLIEEWKNKLSTDKNFKIGICWQGKKDHFLEHNPFTRRAVALALFAPIAAIEGVSVYSLQKIGGTEQQQDVPFALHCIEDNFDQLNGRFMDSAALIMNLDLIISIDTSIVHLAGALGKPIWVLIPSVPEWRWMTERTDTPWYPQTMRLFRQQKQGEWEAVVEELVIAIKKLIYKN